MSLDAVGQQLPDGGQLARQQGQAAQVDAAFGGAVEVAAARGGEAEFLRRLMVKLGAPAEQLTRQGGAGPAGRWVVRAGAARYRAPVVVDAGGAWGDIGRGTWPRARARLRNLRIAG